MGQEGRVFVGGERVPAPAVRAQLARVLESPAFARAPRLRRFLTYCVEEALAGRPERLKEYSLGVDVFDRGAAFDPKTDPIVRVDARRLRERVAAYYAGPGAGDPVEILLPAGGYAPLFRLRSGQGAPAAGVRLAVAPFEGPADDPLARRFAEGLTDELMLALGRRGGLRLVAAPRAPHDTSEAQALADELDAPMILTGKVRHEGDAMRVRVALTAAADGAQAWADRYDAPVDDVAALVRLQDELAERIAKLVGPRLGPAPRERRAPTHDREAYELYLRGRHQLDAAHPEPMAEALRLLQAAVDRDPGFAEAWAAMADGRFKTGIFGLAAPRRAFAAAREAANAALAIDPDLAAAYAQLGRVRAVLDHDFAAAESDFDRALALDPRAAAARQMRAFWLLAPLGRLAEATAEIEACLDQKPYARSLRIDYARLLIFQRRFDEAVRQLELILDFEPDLPGGPWTLATAYEHAGRIAEGRAMHERQVGQFADTHPLVTRWMTAVRALWSGEAETARALVEAMDAETPAGPVGASVMVDAWRRLGEADRMLDWLERTVEARMPRAAHLAVDPDYAALRDTPRFRALLGRMGLSGVTPP